jgi:GNAT superfamily N-acetyltransferase
LHRHRSDPGPRPVSEVEAMATAPASLWQPLGQARSPKRPLEASAEGVRNVRLLGPDDAAAYQALRLDALARHPGAFRASFDEEAGQSLEEFAARLEADAIFGGFCGDALCGLAGLEIPQVRNKRHKGTLFGVYVCPDRRRAGLGAALVGAVIDHARGRVEQLHAAVVITADPARALYRKLGFQPYGLEPRALKVGDQVFDQELLVLRLDGAEPAKATP